MCMRWRAVASRAVALAACVLAASADPSGAWANGAVPSMYGSLRRDGVRGMVELAILVCVALSFVVVGLLALTAMARRSAAVGEERDTEPTEASEDDV
jgi:hypothetical protein